MLIFVQLLSSLLMFPNSLQLELASKRERVFELCAYYVKTSWFTEKGLMSL